MPKNMFINVCVLLGMVSFVGCAAVETSISKKDLVVNTKMSETIFLNPVSPAQRTIFVEVRNSSDRENFDIQAQIQAAIASVGYQVIDDPMKANYWLQANVLMVEKGTADEANQSLLNGYGGAFGGAVVGAVAGKTAGRKKETLALGALVGATVGFIGDTVTHAMVEDVLFLVVTDVQVVEKAAKGVKIQTQSAQHLTQGKDGGMSQHYQEETDRIKYRTRVVSTANKVNLNYAEAKPLLVSGLTRSLANLF